MSLFVVFYITAVDRPSGYIYFEFYIINVVVVGKKTLDLVLRYVSLKSLS